MDIALQREIDARAKEEMALFIHVHGQDKEAVIYAAGKLIKLYAGAGKHGALLNLGARLPKELEGKAELAIVNSIPLHEDPVPGREPKKYGILNDLAFDRQRPEAVRIAAGKKHVDRLLERIKRGDVSAKTEIDALPRRRYHRDVKEYARRALDAFEAAKDGAKNAFKGKKMRGQGAAQQKATAFPAQGRTGGFVP